MRSTCPTLEPPLLPHSNPKVLFCLVPSLSLTFQLFEFPLDLWGLNLEVPHSGMFTLFRIKGLPPPAQVGSNSSQHEVQINIHQLQDAAHPTWGILKGAFPHQRKELLIFGFLTFSSKFGKY